MGPMLMLGLRVSHAQGGNASLQLQTQTPRCPSRRSSQLVEQAVGRGLGALGVGLELGGGSVQRRGDLGVAQRVAHLQRVVCGGGWRASVGWLVGVAGWLGPCACACMLARACIERAWGARAAGAQGGDGAPPRPRPRRARAGSTVSPCQQQPGPGRGSWWPGPQPVCVGGGGGGGGGTNWLASARRAPRWARARRCHTPRTCVPPPHAGVASLPSHAHPPARNAAQARRSGGSALRAPTGALPSRIWRLPCPQRS